MNVGTGVFFFFANFLIFFFTVEETDELLENCFYQALLNASKVELPILVSTFTSQFLYPVW